MIFKLYLCTAVVCLVITIDLWMNLLMNTLLQVDFSSDSTETQGTNISQVALHLILVTKLETVSDTLLLQVVYFGLHIVTPLLSLDLLKYPKFCYDVRYSILHEGKRPLIFIFCFFNTYREANIWCYSCAVLLVAVTFIGSLS